VKGISARAKDAVRVGTAFDSQRGDPDYDHILDIDDDGHCNAKDAVAIGLHFGEHWE
jgi:hypothetical protein